MALKSYRLKTKKKKRKNKSIGEITKAGIGATIGVAFISTIADVIKS